MPSICRAYEPIAICTNAVHARVIVFTQLFRGMVRGILTRTCSSSHSALDRSKQRGGAFLPRGFTRISATILANAYDHEIV